ncbi:hypothetical protein LUW77_02720 [Streptomyces radiopugnans]|nr:hypothetical protein LUW77_02720 [Streptomyces radiopugnans]
MSGGAPPFRCPTVPAPLAPGRTGAPASGNIGTAVDAKPVVEDRKLIAKRRGEHS